jgi:aryl-alcohol dehydrogenase-like predicted oxidoreductase
VDASKIVLGTVQFGLDYGINNSSGKPNETNVFEILNQANRFGVNELDTADGYGEATNVLRRYFQQTQNTFKIMTKFSLRDSLSFEEIFNQSLARLGVSSIDGYYFHSFSDFLKFEEFGQVHSLKKSGKLKNLAVSLYSDDDLEIAAEHPEVDIIQLPFNILDRGERKITLLKKAKSLNKKIYVRSVFLQGLFFISPSRLPPKLQSLEKVIFEIQQLAEQYRMNIEKICLNYVYHKNYIDKLVLGVDSSVQLAANINSIQSSFSHELEQKLEQILVSDTSLLNPSNWK